MEERNIVMTQAAKLKSAIRARAVKTGESYTAARRHVLAAKPPLVVSKPTPVPAEAPAPVEAVKAKDPRVPRGELSDKTAKKSTGHGLDHWFEVLDRFGAANHTKAADFLFSEHKVQAWHAQMITVTWERRRGLRVENQSCTGTFHVSVSRTLGASVDHVTNLLNDSAFRRKWLEGAAPALVKAMEDAFAAGKSVALAKSGYARIRYKWLSSIVEIRITETAARKSSLVADSSALPDHESVAVRREQFTQALDHLREIVAD